MRAQPPKDAGAEALVREGVRLRRAHQNEEALDAFRRAFSVDPSSSTRAQIAFAEQALGRWIDAENDLALALGEHDAWIEHHRPELEESLRVIAGHLAWIRVEANAPWAEIALDGAPVGERREIRTTAGVHHLVVKDGDATQSRDIEVAPEEHARAIFVVEPKGGKETSAPPDSQPRALSPSNVPISGRSSESPAGAPSSPSRTAPIVIGGIGAAGIVAGSYFGIRAIVAKGDRQDHCRADNVCDAEGIAADSRLRSSATASSVAFLAGAAFIGTAFVWWILQKPRSSIHAGLGGPGGPLGATMIGTFE